MKLKFASWLLLACVLIFTIIGCIPKKTIISPQTEQSQSSVTEEKSKLGTLTIRMPKTTYKLGEAIPITLTLKIGKFDLLVPQSSVEPGKMLSMLVLKSAGGTPIKFSKTILEQKPQMLKKDGQSVQGKLGTELKADTEKSILIENLLEYYPLTQPGAYTAQLNLVLPVYKDTVMKKPDNILELEEEIKAFQSDSRLTANKKQIAIAAMREEIKTLEEQGHVPQMYVIMDSFRGNAEIQSNVIEFTIQ